MFPGTVFVRGAGSIVFAFGDLPDLLERCSRDHAADGTEGQPDRFAERCRLREGACGQTIDSVHADLADLAQTKEKAQR
ncbi:hypothetical protein Slala05_77800 [Streptomyces lavendulae subsp. lavendulae]|nr:hypothetical protein Slala05_77800 [Streptomyces lavendulae subsp. lavendulae]